MHAAAARARSLKVGADGARLTERLVPEEVPVALVYNGSTHAVMMASPSDLEAFGVGFSLSEGIVGAAGEIESLEVARHDAGIELRMWLKEASSRKLAQRRRTLAGPTGCGLCGIESLEAAMPATATVAPGLTVTTAEIGAAMAALAPAQALNQQTRAVHAAGFWTPGRGLVAVLEDVGRHNALDKLIGTLARTGTDPRGGLVLLTCRVSVEMVQKAATAGIGLLVAVSAPTALALGTAREAGITLVGIARDDGFEVFTHPGRIRDLPMDRKVEQKLVEHAA